MTVFNKFLASGDNADIAPTEIQAETNSGQAVDIVIDDDLPDTATAPSFNLSSIAQQASGNDDLAEADDVQNESPISGEEQGFRSSSLDTITTTSAPPVADDVVSATDAVPHISDASKYSNDDSISDSGSELGVLPDIESLGIEDETTPAEEADELIQDSVFAETGDVKPIAPTVPPSEMGDAKEIAAAIRTALVKDM